LTRFERDSIGDVFLDYLGTDARILGELLNGYELMLLFAQLVFDFLEQAPARAFTFAGDPLHVLWIDATSV
jgi:hypothetical protein